MATSVPDDRVENSDRRTNKLRGNLHHSECLEFRSFPRLRTCPCCQCLCQPADLHRHGSSSYCASATAEGLCCGSLGVEATARKNSAKLDSAALSVGLGQLAKAALGVRRFSGLCRERTSFCEGRQV